MRDDWRRFKTSKPGQRFRDRYHRRRRSGQGRFALRKVLLIVCGLVIAVVSLLLAPLPGPGWGTFLVGLTILAGELRIVARLLDRAELKLKGPARRTKVIWMNLPTAIKRPLVVIVPVCGAALGMWVLLSGFRLLL